MSLASVRKFVVAGIGVLAQVAASGVVPAEYQQWAAVILAVATALGVYAVPNDLAYVGKHEDTNAEVA